MRSGELRALKWGYIDRDVIFVRLPAEVTKEKKSKNIPINDHFLKVLQSVPRAIQHDYVFTYQGKPIYYRNGNRRSFRSTCNKAGIPYGKGIPDGVTFHDIRRTVKTNTLNAEIDKAHRDMILGHSLQGMDVHYLAPAEDTLTQAMNRYTRWLDDQISTFRASVDPIKKGLERRSPAPCEFWHARRDSNPRPTDSKSGALSN